ncbi:putative serine incorporator [Vitis vinifera]|uniref:Putative serine incorporator n=1 Tax=Vitis vinifera TaxID=29760 RepID=A0A438EIN2_VITVI|nr:putative serine incorporator [Vitis vinifera]
MESGASSGNGRHPEGMKESWFSQFRNSPNPWMARYVYGLMFLITNLLAWAVRDYGRGALTEMERIKKSKNVLNTCVRLMGPSEIPFARDYKGARVCEIVWEQKEFCALAWDVLYPFNNKIYMTTCLTVLRSKKSEILRIAPIQSRWKQFAHEGSGDPQNPDISKPEFQMKSVRINTFYFIMFLSTAGTSKLHKPRELWHSGWWSAKIILWVALMMLPFLVPSAFIQLYGEIAHFGAGYHYFLVFLLIQLISIISFIKWLNDCCHSGKYADRCRIHVMLLATTAYVICIMGIILMYIWYVPEPSCLLNIFFITWTLVLLQLMTSVSLHPKVDESFLTPGLMGLYVVFLCWCAIRSEPPEDRCNQKVESATKADWLTIISFIVALLAMVIATFSTGIDSKCFQFRKDDTQAEDDVPYGYGFFHFVFATGAMYFSMLLIGWNTHHSIRKNSIMVKFLKDGLCSKHLCSADHQWSGLLIMLYVIIFEFQSRTSLFMLKTRTNVSSLIDFKVISRRAYTNLIT